VFRALLQARQQRGAIDFETTETYIVCNPMGKIEKIIPRTRNDAHRLIEECMLAANVCAADFLIRHEQPSTFRIHATPTEEKLNQLRELPQAGRPEPGRRHQAAGARLRRPDAAKSRSARTRPCCRPCCCVRCSRRSTARTTSATSAWPTRHYAHFTSPIRRYPDLLTHRAIKAVLAGQEVRAERHRPVEAEHDDLERARKQAAKDKAEGKQKDPKDLTVWDALGVHCSANERRADEASRDVENWLKCFYMKDRLGEEFTGVISGVTPFGIFVQLDELYVEGLVHVTGLGTDYFQYDEARHELRGERTGQVYQPDRPRDRAGGARRPRSAQDRPGAGGSRAGKSRGRAGKAQQRRARRGRP
jgi:ribonuclease R